jgi:hypothetical protein
MPDEVKVREDLGITWVESSGPVSMEDLLGSLAQVVKIHRERGIARALVNAAGETSLPGTTQLHEFGSELARQARSIRFAIVVSRVVKEDLVFAETVMQNRGVVIRVFDSVQPALDWLQE